MYCCCAAQDVEYQVIDASAAVTQGETTTSFQVTPATAPVSETQVQEPAKEPSKEPAEKPAKAAAEEKTSSPKDAASPVKSFVAKLSKQPAEMLGWRLDCVGLKYIFIFSISESGSSPVSMYNSNVPDELAIKQGDYIMSVNGVSGVAGMVDIIDKSSELEVTICRPHFFKATVEKTEALGLELKYWQSATTLLIGEIRPGAITKQNVDIIPEDRILGINGKTGTVEDLLQAIRAMDTLEFEVSRCPA